MNFSGDQLFLLLTATTIVAGFTYYLRVLLRKHKQILVDGAAYPLEGHEGDAMTHLLLADLIRKERHKIPRATPRFLLSSTMDYPALFHKLMSYLGRERLEWRECQVNPFFDGLHAGGLFLAAWWLLVPSTNQYNAVLLAAFVSVSWALTPLFTQDPVPRSLIGERAFGYLFGHAYLFFIVMYAASNALSWLCFALASFTIAAASSKFAVQAMVFISVALGIFLLDWRFPAITLLALLFSVLATGGYTWFVFKGSIRHSHFYATWLVHIHGYTKSFSNLSLLQTFQFFVRGRFRLAWRALRGHPLQRTPALVPWLVPFFALQLSDSGFAVSDTIATTLDRWVWAVIFISSLTALDQFKFLGESVRYYEYGIFPIIFLSVVSHSDLILLCALFAFLIALYPLARSYCLPLRFTSATKETIELCRWLQPLPISTVFTVPGRLSFPLAYRTEHNFVWWFANAPSGALLEKWKSLFSEQVHFPYIAPEALINAREKFDADLIVIDKRGAEITERVCHVNYLMPDNAVVFENDRYVVFDAERYAVSSNSLAIGNGNTV